MSEFARLNRGFVNWRGQRVFVPSFGAPRIVSSAADETRILKLRFSMDFAPILVVVVFIATAWWTDGFERWVEVAVLALGLGLFGLAVFLEQRWTSHWPRQTVVPFSRARFMVSYYRSLSVGDRVWELALGVGGVALVTRGLERISWPSSSRHGTTGWWQCPTWREWLCWCFFSSAIRR